ncbi:MAG: GTP-binding protein [Candidatus Helarchaeota archaeon]|nr:GTP-binding protein [Candidatus Helarchaeota archaeon]
MSEYEKVYKLVMLGDEAVGKTSLIIQHTEHKFSESYKMTIGTDISAKLIEVEEKGAKTNVYLIIWDIGGQEKYRILRESYLRGASAALLVFDLSNKTSFHSVYNWVDETKKFCGGSIPMLLLGNKLDLASERSVPPKEGKKMAKDLNVSYFETSAKSGDNVDKAFNEIVKLILQT